MTRLWLLAPFALAAVVILPLACGEDETTASSTQSSTPASNVATNAASTTGANTGGMTGGGGTPGTGGNAQGGMAPGGMAPGGASMDNCDDCFNQAQNNACQAEADACDQVPDDVCNDWMDCYENCIDNDFTAACFMDCDNNAPPEATAFKTCVCGNCSNACVPFCP